MTITKEQVHVITSVERRHKWSVDEKRSIVQETYLPGMSLSHVARKYAISPCQLFKWRKLMEEGAIEGIRGEEGVVPMECSPNALPLKNTISTPKTISSP